MTALPFTVEAGSSAIVPPWRKPRLAASPPAVSTPVPDAATIGAFVAETVGDAAHLVAIVPDGSVTGRWFGDDATAATAWAAQRNAGGANVYWTVNRVTAGVDGKPRKSDVRAARFAHVDIDPPRDGPFDLDAKLAELTAADASLVIASGGGLQAFWRLEEESVNLDAIELVNRGLAAAFAGDHCHNIDRLMRLPGTVNWPDARKRARGRTPTLARIASADDGTTHDALRLAHRFPAPADTPDAPAERPEVDAGPAELLTADDLGLDAFAPLRMAIEHPPGRDHSRDALACAGDMVRAGLTDAQVIGVLLNPANPVSAHCLAQTNQKRAAARCLSRARGDQARVEAETAEGAALAAALGAKAGLNFLDLEDVADWAGVDVPPQRWVLDGWLPVGEAALLTGAGAIGKSLVAQQLATCVAAGRPFMGVGVDAATAVYVTCEDGRDVLQRRQQAIAALLRVDLQDLRGRLLVRSWKGQIDNELVTFDAQRRMLPTARFDGLRTAVIAAGARLVILDNTSHLFGGDENVKREVAAFCNLLNGLAETIDGVVLLLGHPNKAGVNSAATAAGNQYGGSVAWENQVRSRMYLQGVEDDHDARELSNPKANYAPKGGVLRFRWFQGAFASAADLPKSAARDIAASVMAAADNAAFLACLDERTRQRRAVSEKSGRNLAPVVFERMPEAKGVGKKRLEAAMDRLFRTGEIERAELWKGEDRKPVFGLRRVAGNAAGNGAETRCGNGGEHEAETAGNTHPISNDMPGGPR